MRRIVLATLVSLAFLSPALAQQRDVAGSRDYPGIGRFKGSVVTGYQVRDFDRSRLQAAPFKDGKPTAERRPEGRVKQPLPRRDVGRAFVADRDHGHSQLLPALKKGGVVQNLVEGEPDCAGSRRCQMWTVFSGEKPLNATDE